MNYKPHPAQEKFLNSEEPMTFWMGGHPAGASYAWIRKLFVEHQTFHPGYQSQKCNDNAHPDCRDEKCSCICHSKKEALRHDGDGNRRRS